MSDTLRAIQLSGAQVMAILVVLARVSPLFALAPLFSSKLLPARARGLCAVGLSVGLAPIVAKGVRPPDGVLAMIVTLAGEVLVGMTFAFVLSVLFAAVSSAGAFLDTLIGFSYGSLVDPITGTQTSVLSNLYAMVAVLVFIAIGGDTWVVEGFARTYDLVPAGTLPSLARLAHGADAAFAQVFLSALEVAGPVVLALVLTDAALGIVSRSVPQLNVFAVGFPAKIVVGLVVIGASLPFAAGWIADAVQGSVSDALRTLQGA